MLILTRKIGESINIGTEIKIQLIDIKGKQVRIGIEAPVNYPIHREEIYQKILEENKSAATTSSDINEFSKQWKARSGKEKEFDK